MIKLFFLVLIVFCIFAAAIYFVAWRDEQRQITTLRSISDSPGCNGNMCVNCKKELEDE